MNRGAAELGFGYKWFDRDIEEGPISEATWETAVFYARFAGWDWLTISAEGGLWDVEHEDFPGQPYARWTLGAGAVARAYSRGRIAVDATIAYNEIYDHDESAYRFDKRTNGLNVGVALDYRLTYDDHSLDLWAGPMFVEDSIENFAYGTDDPIESEPDANWGAAAGANAVLFKHASVFGYVLFIDHPQVRIGAALRLDGVD